MLNRTYKLNNNINIPMIGLGTWGIANEDIGKVIADAVNQGYRLIDSSPIYNNEEGIGEAINNSIIQEKICF